MNMLTTFILGIVVGWVIHSLMDRLGERRLEGEQMDPEDAEVSARMFGCVKWVVPAAIVLFLGVFFIGRLLLANNVLQGFGNPFTGDSAESTETTDPATISSFDSTDDAQTDNSAETNSASSEDLSGADVTGGSAQQAVVQQPIIVIDNTPPTPVPPAPTIAPLAEPTAVESTLVLAPVVGNSAETQQPESAESYPAPAPQEQVPAPAPQPPANGSPPRPVIDTHGVETFRGTDLTIVGTSQPDSVVLVMLNGILYGTAKSDANGSWVVGGKVSPADYTIVAYLMSPVGLIDSEPVYLNVLP